MITQDQLKELNLQFKGAKPSEIIKKALELSNEAVVTTNFRPYEAAILHAVNSVKPNISVVWCDTGYNTPQTYRHANQVIEDLKLSSSAFDARYDNALASTFVIKQRQGNLEKISGNVRASFTESVLTREGPMGSKNGFLVSARASYLDLLFTLID